jgi:hypothetical protein
MRARAGRTVNAPEQFEGRGRAIITASSGMEYAYEGDRLEGEGQPSVFTEAVVEGLETGKADLDQDQLISVDDLYGYVYDRVKETTPTQTPNKKSEIEGPLYLARSTYRPQVQPATLDPELLARTEDRYAGIRVGAVHELAHLLISRDPAVALAAREALGRMTDDDSRQVSASAQAALAAAEQTGSERAEAEPSARARTQRGPAEREQSQRDRADTERTERARGEPADVSAADRSELGNAAIEPRRARGAAARERQATASWPQRHWRLMLAAVVTAVAAAGGAIIATQGGGGPHPPASGSNAEYQTLLGLLPASIRSSCWNDPTLKGGRWLTRSDQAPNQASAQANCSKAVAASSSYLTYGLWPSASKAQDWARKAIQVPCARTTTNAMKNSLPPATSGCRHDKPGPGIDMWWNQTGSRVAGWFNWPSNDEKAALTQWQAVARAR